MMACNFTWNGLADEYLHEAQVQTKIIEKYRNKLRSLKNPDTSRDAYRLKSLLNVLYAQRRDLINTALYLKKNYPDEKAA